MASETDLQKLLAAVDGLAKRFDLIEADARQSKKDEDVNGEPSPGKSLAESVKKEELAALAKKDAQNIPEMIRENRMLRERLDGKERELSQRMQAQGPLSDRDKADLAATQARFDAVALAFGKQVRAPLHGETPTRYRIAMMRDYQKYSPDLKSADLSGCAAENIPFFESRIIADAQAESARPSIDLPEDGGLRKVVTKDTAGRSIISFYGKNTFVKQFQDPCIRKVSRLLTANDIAMERAINSVAPRKY